ncbi:rhodanese-like domain-containing protein [Kitasatospora sp. NPDC056731]|uniref:rhodanese-like domain-containing protein n=1 Tax=Kitasatospora sp. NPDC056731 TaxID=3155422 RepID=UPI00341902FE
MDQVAFVALVSAGQPSAPGYFGYDADLNRRERGLFDPAAVRALAAADFLRRRAEGAVVLDARDPLEFAAGHLAESVNLPADGRFAELSGTVFGPGREILVIAPDGRGEELVTRLARIGFDRAAGHLADPEAVFRAHPELMGRARRLTVHALREALDEPRPPLVIDVRGAAEREAGAIPGSLHLPLAELPARHGDLPADRRLVLHCAGGLRSSVAASLLRHHGHAEAYDLLGGYAAWEAAPAG